MSDTLRYTPLEREVHFAIEVSAKGEEDWTALNARKFDSWIVALSALQRYVAEVQDQDEREYRIVRRIVHTDVVTHV
jgi:hypothetical protein